MGFLTNDFQAQAPGLQDETQRRQRFAQALQQSQGNPQALAVNQPQDYFRKEQGALIGQLQHTATGQGPSAASPFFQAAQDQNMAAAAAMAGSGHAALNPALAARNAANVAAQGNQQAAAQGAMIRAQEAMGAQNQLAGLMGQARGQDIGMSQFQQGLGAQYEGMGLSSAEEQLRAQMEAQKINQEVAAGNQDRYGRLAGGIISGLGQAGSAAAMSDERVKTDIQDGSKAIYGFLDALKAHQYKYKNEKHGAGTQHSVMAQELERTPVGKAMVEETPEGKRVDYGKGFGAILAAQSHLHSRLKQIEGR